MALRGCRYDKGLFEISYDILNPDKERSILFLHGWGSEREIMKQAFSSTLDSYRHIYIDMPGFGKSPNDIFLETKEYASIVKLFLDEIGMQADIVVGHSFGGKVATVLNPNCLVLLSSSGIKVPKSFGVKAKIAIYKTLRKMGLGALRRYFTSEDARDMNDAMYETFKYVVNEDFEPNFEKVDGKALLFWGKSDTATPLWTTEKIMARIPGISKLHTFEGGHYFFLQHSREIASIIEKECP